MKGNAMQPVRCFAVITLYAALAVVAPATGDAQSVSGDPEPATPPVAAAVLALAADPAAGVADLPENRAEIDALRRGELELERPEGALPAAAADTARHARRAAYEAVVAGQYAKVRALADRLAGATGDEALSIQKDIEREKTATGRLLLEVQLEFATRDSDQARVQRLVSALAAWDAPAPAYAPVDRHLPAESPVSANTGR
jgi:hypothetical protein